MLDALILIILVGFILDYNLFIESYRKKREDMINAFRKENDQENENFLYFPIEPKWRTEGEVVIRKPKDGMIDYKINFVRIGKINFSLENNPQKLDLYQIENQPDEYFIYLKDATSGKDSYGLGRFVPIIKEKDKFIIDFNLSFTPACGHVEGSACPWARESVPIPIQAGEKALPYTD